jgi:RNA polymerase sigma-70 factor (ECF subfamily)
MNFRVQNGEESELITAILGGDTHLYHQLIRPYERRVYVTCLRYLRDEAEAEDVAQETFIRAFRNLRTFRGDAKFSTWLISIALNEARSRLRKKAGIRIVQLDENHTPGMLAAPASLREWRQLLPSDAMEQEEIGALLRQAIEILPFSYREVFLLRHVQELNVSETSRILDISSSLVKVRLHRARMMLRRLLEPKLKEINVEMERACRNSCR